MLKSICASIERRKHEFYEANPDRQTPKGKIDGWIEEALDQYEPEYPELIELRDRKKNPRFITDLKTRLKDYPKARVFIPRLSKRKEPKIGH